MKKLNGYQKHFKKIPSHLRIGKPCIKCGGRLRYARDSGCVVCKRRYNDKNCKNYAEPDRDKTDMRRAIEERMERLKDKTNERGEK